MIFLLFFFFLKGKKETKTIILLGKLLMFKPTCAL